MAFSSGGGGTQAMGDINVTPLVDVLLVLLIIFMVTAPMSTNDIQIDLPQRSKNQEPPKKDPPPPVRIRIDQSGGLFWDNVPMPKAAIEASMLLESVRDPQPMIELETHADAQYENLTDVLSMAKNAGLEKIGFVETL